MRKLFSLFLLSLFGLMGSSTAYAENFYTFGLGAGVAPRYIGGKDYSGRERVETAFFAVEAEFAVALNRVC
jgi:hypothetical protein